MRKFVTVVGAAALFSLVPLSAQGQVLLGPTLAFHDDADFGIGATVGFDADNITEGFGFMGDFIYYFPEFGDFLEFNANATYDIPLEGSTVLPFLLGGLNFARYSFEVLGISGSTTDVNLNLGGGIAFDAGSLRPKAGLRLIVGGGGGFVIFATLPFVVGGN
jgi:hypothetical protein